MGGVQPARALLGTLLGALLGAALGVLLTAAVLAVAGGSSAAASLARGDSGFRLATFLTWAGGVSGAMAGGLGARGRALSTACVALVLLPGLTWILAEEFPAVGAWLAAGADAISARGGPALEEGRVAGALGGAVLGLLLGAGPLASGLALAGGALAAGAETLAAPHGGFPLRDALLEGAAAACLAVAGATAGFGIRALAEEEGRAQPA